MGQDFRIRQRRDPHSLLEPGNRTSKQTVIENHRYAAGVVDGMLNNYNTREDIKEGDNYFDVGAESRDDEFAIRNAWIADT